MGRRQSEQKQPDADRICKFASASRSLCGQPGALRGPGSKRRRSGKSPATMADDSGPAGVIQPGHGEVLVIWKCNLLGTQ